MEPDIENMTMNEYLEYEAAKERQLWDDVRSRRSLTNYNEADVNSFHRNKSKTFSYPYSHNLTPLHPCFLPVQPYLKNYLVSTNESNDEEDGDDGDTFNMWDITVEDVERIRKFFNVPDEIDKIVQPVTPEPIHTTPPNDDYVAPATKSILDEHFEEFGDEILNVAMIDKEANFNPTKGLEELERLLAMRPQSNFMEIQEHSVIINTDPFIHTQLMSPLYAVFKTSKPCKVDKDIISPGRRVIEVSKSWAKGGNHRDLCALSLDKLAMSYHFYMSYSHGVFAIDKGCRGVDTFEQGNSAWEQVEYEVSEDDDSDFGVPTRSVPKEYELGDTSSSSGI
ncbi:hypothetical protein Tco_0285742 [Tanacetum coccineum]